MRETPIFKIIDLLKKKGQKFYTTICLFRKYILHAWPGGKSIELNEEIISGFDAVVISTNHSMIDNKELSVSSKCVVYTRNAMKGLKNQIENHIIKA